ncbi:MAG: glycosyltransferase family 4 protein [Candidatus Aminicenantes bacterium]|nr:MAG: glycosyltransferase family 4 protein [Candidatus Aminicenantes bacterium]
MKICLVHGYLLTGTGSNIYVANLARKLCSMGHDVIVMCQEPHPENLEFVSEFFEFDETNTSYKKKYEVETSFPGTCHVFRSELRKKLLVYVIDKYEGFDEIQTFQDSSLEEIETYIKQNATALNTVIKDYEPDVIQANHSIMQPYISYLATTNTDIPYFATLHGSALNFSVKKSKRLHEYAMKGLNNASSVIAVSEYNAREFHDYLASMSEVLKTELKVIPAGVDIELFSPLANGRKIFLPPLQEKIKEKKRILTQGEKLIDKRELERKVKVSSPSQKLKKLFSEIAQKYNQRHPDQDVLDTLNSIDWVNDKIVLFIGKYLWTKGIQVVITATPLILKKVPKARFLFVGFGDSKEILQSLIFALGTGNHALYEFMLKAHSEIDSGSVALTPPVCAMFLERLKDRSKYDKFFEEARRLSIIERCHFTGIMSHEELKYLLPISDVFVAPSIFTEAFGMVAIEAMASGVFPLISYQYGFKEINDAVFPIFEETLPRMPKLYLNSHLVPNLAKSIITVLKLGVKTRREVREKCRRLVEKNYSWDSISKKYVETFNK